MIDKSEKEKRKQIISELKKKAEQKFSESLPISRDLFKGLFDYLDAKLDEKGCDNTLKLTEEFLNKNQINNIVLVKQWLGDNGGYCDCEVLANVEEKFE